MVSISLWKYVFRWLWHQAIGTHANYTIISLLIINRITYITYIVVQTVKNKNDNALKCYAPLIRNYWISKRTKFLLNNFSTCSLISWPSMLKPFRLRWQMGRKCLPHYLMECLLGTPSKNDVGTGGSQQNFFNNSILLFILIN